MSFQETTVSRIRMVALGLTGLSCLAYALMAMVQNSPQPFWWFIPGITGLIATLVIFLAFSLATPNARRMAHDEMQIQMDHRAQRHAYWVALFLYPLGGLAGYFDLLSASTTFAVMGTLTGAAYLLPVSYNEWRMS